MGHRALVAYADADGRYDLHYSHWGAADFALARTIGPETPFGGDPDRPECDRAPAVEPRPLATDVSLPTAVAEHLDFLYHEAFYVVAPEYSVTTYRTLWFGLEGDCDAVESSPTVGHGALVATNPREADCDAERFRATKAVVGDVLDRGALTESAAVDCLATAVERRLGDRREVLLSPRLRE